MFAVSATVATGVLIGAGLVGVAPAPPAAAIETVQTEVSSTAVDSSIVKAADLSQFKPGNIISDAVFFNSATMTEAQIQSFLESKVSSCRSGYTCLKDYYVQTRSIAADPMCGAYSGGGMERASRVIYKVAQACGINPQVIIVMLQKEQGLITSTAPSSWAYQAAMGQGCPDTAACDTAYYGLFNQVYGGARQMKRYANPPGTSNYFTWYAPGKTWNVQYHPNTSCGRGAVLIENQATANLYYYTPYQPNAAALSAGYGLGDGCSSYGNRNFFNYFTDWFGSTQVAYKLLISRGADIYLVSGATRYHITADDWPAFSQALGSAVAVGDQLFGALVDGGQASRFIRNTSTGEISYIDGGSIHRFATCDLVALWGGSCASLTQLASQDFTQFKKSSEMTEFARTTTGGRIHSLTASTLVPYYDAAAVTYFTGKKNPYAAVLSAAALASRKVSYVRFVPSTLVFTNAGPDVYLPQSDGRLLRVPTWAVTSDLGLGQSARRVPQSALSRYGKPVDLTRFVSCGDATAYGSGGTLYRVKDAGGFSVTALDEGTCAKLRVSSSAAGELFVKTSSSPDVYQATKGELRYVPSMSRLVALAGSASPRILTISASAFKAFTIGSPYTIPADELHAFAVGQFVVGTSSPKVWLPTQDGRLLYLPSWDIADALGIRATATRVSDSTLSGYRTSDSLGWFITCDGVVSYVSGGKRYPAAGAEEFASVSLDESLCALLPAAWEDPRPIFIKSATRPAVYHLVDGVRRYIPTMARLTELSGTTAPTILTVSAAALSAYAEGDQYFTTGELIKSPSSPEVYLFDGEKFHYVPAFSRVEALGLSTRVRTVNSWRSPTGSDSLSTTVVCDDTVYEPRGGVLYSAGRAAKSSDTVLGSALCSALSKVS
ncbi:hypothetical protein [Microbacterium sp. NPDC076895]|uniref:hypothetical protein n=1 Tax=Microbacterium sp. NPDC076895 TaxID=3154957 RepID=UPI003424B9A0